MPDDTSVAKVWPAGDSAWQIRLPLPWRLNSVNVFLFRRQDGYMLMDTGINSAESLAALEAALTSLGLEWRAITSILISHMHPDHIGAAPEIRRRSGAPIRMHPLEAALVKPRDPGSFFKEAQAYLLEHGVPPDDVKIMREQAQQGADATERFIADESISSGDPIEYGGGTLRTVMAPGHSPAQMCFYCAEQKILFSTDAILERTTPNIGVHWFYQGNPLGDYFDTLKTLEQLDVGTIYPSHGKPFEGHREWIAATRKHHRGRCDRLAALVKDEALHGYEIAGRIWGEKRPAGERRFAMAEGLAHLEYMSRDGRVEQFNDNGVTFWKAA